jgi:hypothetical protein
VACLYDVLALRAPAGVRDAGTNPGVALSAALSGYETGTTSHV